MKRIAVLFVLGLLPWAALHAQQPAQTTFRVSARVQAVCDITASDLAFGNYTAQSGTPLLGTTQLVATCTPNTQYNVGLDAGTSAGATTNQRKMISGANTLDYQLYSDASRTTIWGDTSGTNTVAGVGTGVAVQHVVYGTVPAGQVVPAADYGDTITVRIYY